MNANKTGSLIANLRQEKGLTQRELADALQVSDKAVSRWETGRGMPDIENLEALASALDVGVAELLHGERMAEPVTPDTAAEIATDGLSLARQLLRRRSTLNALLGLLAGVVVVTLLFVHLTSPIAIPHRDGLVRVEELADGTLVAVADADVTGWDVGAVDGDVFVGGHTTRWDQLTGSSGTSVAVLGDAGEVRAVLYYPGTSGDVVIYGEIPDAGVVTLPRLTYNMWLAIGVVASVVGLVAYALLRGRWYAGRVLRLALVPVCLTASLVAVLWGRFGEVYDAAFYLSGILLVAIALYAMCLVVLGRRTDGRATR